MFGLDPKGYLNDLDRIGWLGLNIPAPAESYIYPASQLRNQTRTLARSGQVDHAGISQFADRITTSVPTPVAESSKPYDLVLRRFCLDVKVLAAQQAPAANLLYLCDQLRDIHFWNQGIFLEDRNLQPALVRPLDKLLIQARAGRESAGITKPKAKLQQKAREAERENELGVRDQIDPLVMFKTSDEYLVWDEPGIPTVDAAGSVVPKIRRKKLLKEWEKQKRHDEWTATYQDG